MKALYQFFLICISLGVILTLLSSISEYLFQISKPYMGYSVILLMLFVLLLFANYLSNYLSKSFNKKKGRLRWLVDYKDNIRILAIIVAIFAVFVGIFAYNRQNKKKKTAHPYDPFYDITGIYYTRSVSGLLYHTTNSIFFMAS